MAGHSKWANIKHKKGAQDAKRSKIFQKLSKEIMIAIKEGGNNPDTNAKLRLSIEKAKAGNMPNDNIKKLLETKDKGGADWQEVTYEGYGPGGVAVIVNCLTDNINRTAPAVKHTFSKYGGNLGVAGSVSYLFETKGILVLDASEIDVDTLMMVALEAEVLDIKENDGVVIIETEPGKLLSTKSVLEENGYTEFLSSEVSRVASNTIELTDEINDKLQNLIDAFEDDDDVQDVYTNVQ